MSTFLMEIELLDHSAGICSALMDTIKQLSKSAVPVYTPTNSIFTIALMCIPLMITEMTNFFRCILTI